MLAYAMLAHPHHDFACQCSINEQTCLQVHLVFVFTRYNSKATTVSNVVTDAYKEVLFLKERQGRRHLLRLRYIVVVCYIPLDKTANSFPAETRGPRTHFMQKLTVSHLVRENYRYAYYYHQPIIITSYRPLYHMTIPSISD